MDDLMKKHEMTEEDIKLQFITPAIEGAGWDRRSEERRVGKECRSRWSPYH